MAKLSNFRELRLTICQKQRMGFWSFISKVNGLIMQVASWGGYLLSRDILTVSFAPRDTHEAQVQFALERGVPALIGVLASKRLPYPSRAFDMAHCSRCLIPWDQYGNPTYKPHFIFPITLNELHDAVLAILQHTVFFLTTWFIVESIS